MTLDPKAFRVAALYRFTQFDDPAALQGPLAKACCAVGVRGTLLLARELVAHGPTAQVMTETNLGRARTMAEAWDEASEVCEMDQTQALQAAF